VSINKENLRKLQSANSASMCTSVAKEGKKEATEVVKFDQIFSLCTVEKQTIFIKKPGFGNLAKKRYIANKH